MTKHIIPGETVPLEEFPQAFKERAQRVAEYALSVGSEVPQEVAQVLEAAPLDLRTAQLQHKLTYAALDAWAAGQQTAL